MVWQESGRRRGLTVGTAVWLALATPAHASTGPHSGDVNGSGDVTLADVTCLIAGALSWATAAPAPPCQAVTDADADLDCDGALTVTDIQRAILLRLFAIGGDASVGALLAAGDADGDGIDDACQGPCDGVICPDDGDPCTDDTCNPTTGACGAPSSGAPCDDGDPCTSGDTCAAGVCVGAPVAGLAPGPSPGDALADWFVHPLVGACAVDAVVHGDDLAPAHTFSVVLWRLGLGADDAAPAWDIGAKTGFQPAPPAERHLYQRGPSTTPGVPAVQVRDDTVGFWFDSEAWPHDGEIIPTVVHWDWTPADNLRPFTSPGSAVGYDFDLQVPTASVGGAGAVYVTPVLMFRHAGTGKPFWFVAQAFDLRPPNAEGVFYDACSTCTGLPIVISTLAPGSAFLHLAPGSATFRQTPWSGFTHFGLRITRATFALALQALVAKTGPSAGYSTSPEDYQLIHFNFNPEVYAPTGLGSGQLGLSVRRIHVGRFAAQTVSRVTIRAANTGPSAWLKVYFKTQEDDTWSEDKNAGATFSGGGGWVTLTIDMATNPKWRGTITGLRIDPFDSNDSFGMDDVCVGDETGACTLHWGFDGAAQVASPFFGWTLSGIGSTWTDGALWGGAGTNGDPFLWTLVALESGI